MLDSIYESLSGYPDVIARPLVGLGFVIIGYFFSKVLATLVSMLIRADEKTRLRLRVSRICFWSLWLIFTVVGYRQLPVLAETLEYWTLDPSNVWTQSFLMFAGLLMFWTRPYDLIKSNRLYGAATSRMRSYFIDNQNRNSSRNVRKILGPPIAIGLTVMCGYALVDPDTLVQKVLAVILLPLFGLHLAKIFKEFVLNLFEKVPAARICGNIVFATFLLASVELWV